MHEIDINYALLTGYIKQVFNDNNASRRENCNKGKP